MGLGDSINLGLDSAVQAVKDAAGIVSVSNNSVTPSELPWEISGIQSTFFQSIKIDPSRWDVLYPYRLIVIDSTNNKMVSNSSGLSKPPQITITKGTSSALVDFASPTNGWVFQLPITPAQLSIQNSYSIQTSATLRGIAEEHSGMRFKLINAQGSLGVWAQRSNISTPPGTPGLIQSVFGGTLEAVGSVVGKISDVINSATSNSPANKPVSLLPETSDFGSTSTGYYQALKLEQFLEQYAEAKRDPANASWRLVFDIPKQNQSFVVTPMNYVWIQNANKPMEIMYNFQLKAWRRISLDQPPKVVNANNQPLTPGILQRILGTVGQARQVLGASINLIGAVRSDVDTPLEVLRQTTLFIKNLAGVAATAADLPKQIVSDYQSSIAASMSNLSTSIATAPSTVPTTPTASPLKINSPAPVTYPGSSSAAIAGGASQTSPTGFSSSVVASTNPVLRANLSAVVSAQNGNEGLSLNAVAGGQLGNDAAIMQTLSPLNKVFSYPYQNFSLLDQVPLASLSLTNSQQTTINQILDNANATTIGTLQQYRNLILQLVLQLSNSFGTGSAYYNELYGLPPPIVRTFPITIDEYELLDSLYEVLSSYDILTATTTVNSIDIQTAMEYVAGLATTSNIPFIQTENKILAPVPFGLTIEGIAARYLSDPQRWIEIVTLNGLREPYIDNTGFQLPLLSNAIGRQAVVANSDNLYIGQSISLNSSGHSLSGRTILGIERISSTSFLLTFDGLPDLDVFLLSDNAYIQAYLPGTCNAQQKIFIPSDLPLPAQSSIIQPPSTTTDPLTGLSKVDWLLNGSDIAVNNYGDFMYSSGITNIIQSLRIKFGTIAGTVLTDPNFGLTVQPGTVSSDVQLQNLYNSINDMITEDPRFSGVSNLQIALNGPVLGINLSVTIPGTVGVFPISFALTRPN